MAPTPTGLGYWLVGRDGGIFSFGDARFFGSLGGVRLAEPIVAMAATSNGRGYWLVGADGGVFSFGDAHFYGSLGRVHLTAPIVAMASTPDSKGYWLVGSDGGVFSFGDARFYGSLGGVHLAQPIVAMASAFTGSGSTGAVPGYWLLGADGGVFAFHVPFHGSLPGVGFHTVHAIGITPTVDNRGYWIGTADGTVVPFGDAPNLGDFHTQSAARGRPNGVLDGPWLQLTTVAPPGAAGGTPPPPPPPPPAPVLSLAYGPGTAASMPTGTSASLVATVSLSGRPDGHVPVTFDITGANPQTGRVTTSSSGLAEFSYVGAASGADSIVASAANGATTGRSKSLTVTWTASVSLADTSQVDGEFFAEPAGETSFVAEPGDTPAFSQSFPDVAFNPPAGLVAEPPGAPSPSTVPFSDVVTDDGGAFAGTMPAEANGFQAGANTTAGDLTNFDAVFSGSVSIGKAGYLSLGVISGDGFILGVGGGATGYSGEITGGPASGKTAFASYPVVAANDSCVSSSANDGSPQPGDFPVTVHLPSAGSYPYEIDYFSCDTQSAGAPLRSMVLRVEGVSATPPGSPTIYVGYADTTHQAVFHYFPYPWAGAGGVNFQGCTLAQGCTSYDGGAIRVDNTTAAPMTINKVVITLTAPLTGFFDSGPPPYSCVYDIWAPDAPSGLPEHGEGPVVLQPGQSVIYGQEVTDVNNGCNNTDGEFDTSDVPFSCQQSGIVPQIALTVNGQTATYEDQSQILNTAGTDKAECVSPPLNNESSQWTRIAGPGTGADIPLPPEAALDLEPTQALSGGPLTGTVGTAQTFTATATDADGTNLAGVPVTFDVTGANPHTATATTDAQGVATFTYTATSAGTDTVSATGSYRGLLMESGLAAITQQIPPPGQTSGSGGTPGEAPPEISVTSPADAETLSVPTPVQATIVAPEGETISTWQVTVAPAGGTPATLASGSGAPPTPLADVDPTHMVAGSYSLAVTAVASGGGTATSTVSFQVARTAKVGQFTQTYQDATTELYDFPVSIDRTYSSFDKTVGDFGVGWRLSLSQVSIATNGTLGAGGWAPQPSSCSLLGCSYDYQSTTAHTVTVTLPGGTQEVFDFTPTGGFGPLFFLGGVAGFTPRPGTNTTGTLTAFNDPGVYYGFDGNIYTTASGGTTPYDLTDFTYTDAYGNQYAISTVYGLLAERQPNGACLSFDATGSGSGVDGWANSTGVAPDVNNYDASGTCTGASFPEGIAIARDTQNRVTSITLPNGSTYTYTYDSAGDLTTVTLPGSGGTDSYTYDANHNLLTQTGPDAPTLTENYDSNGKLTSVTDGDGHTIQISNDPGSRTQTLTDPLGKLTTVLSYDTAGDLISDQDISGGMSRTTTYTYDALGDITSTTDPLGHTSTATFDANGNQTSSTDALGQTTTTTYGPMSEITSHTDALGRVSSATYDGSGNPLSATQPSGAKIQMSYDSVGDLLSLTDQLGHTYNLSYSNPGPPTEIVDPLGHDESLSYDENNNLTSIDDQYGDRTSFAYDADGRLTSTTDPTGGVTSRTYDAQGNVASTTDANGNTTTYAYDPAGQLTAITDPDNGTVKLAYDADGNLTSVTDADGHVTTYAYDGFGDRISATDPAGGVTTYTYDADGHVVSSTDPKGQTTTYAYDADGDLVKRVTPDGSTTWAYDADGELVSQVDSTGTTNYTYDADGQVTQVASPPGTIDYAYNADGQRTSMTLPGPKTITYTYDAASNLTAESGLDQTVSFAYDDDNRPTAVTLPDGVATTYAYDPDSNISSVASTNGPTTLTSFAYTRDADGNPTSLTTPAGTTSYTFDKLDRLLSATGPGASSYSYTYDPAGNITSATTDGTTSDQSYDSAGSLTTVGSQSVTSDADGNITGIGTQSFAWNALNQLASTTAGGTPAAYTYNGNGLRVATNTGGSTSSDLWDQVNPTTGQLDTLPAPPDTGATPITPNASGTPAAGSTALPSGLPQLVSNGTDTYLNDDNQTLGQVSGADTATWYLPDDLGSVAGTTGPAGTLLGSTTYTPFGQVATQSGTEAPFGIAGQAQDTNGLVFLRARYLDPDLGRFLSADTSQPNAAGTQGYNEYAYAGDDPEALVDPSGHNPDDETVGVELVPNFLTSPARGYFHPVAPIVGATFTRIGIRSGTTAFVKLSFLVYEEFQNLFLGG